MTVSLPKVVVERVEELIRADGSANSVPDFVRQATVKELERRRGGSSSEPGDVDLMRRLSKK